MSAREVVARAISEVTLDWEDDEPEVWPGHREQADAILAALAAAGYAVVPVEPTNAVIYSGGDVIAKVVPGMHAEEYAPDDAAERAWRAMIAAAQETRDE